MATRGVRIYRPAAPVLGRRASNVTEQWVGKYLRVAGLEEQRFAGGVTISSGVRMKGGFLIQFKIETNIGSDLNSMLYKTYYSYVNLKYVDNKYKLIICVLYKTAIVPIGF